MSARRLPLARQASDRNAASSGRSRARFRAVMGGSPRCVVVPRLLPGEEAGRACDATKRALRAIRQSQRLVEELVAGAAGVTAALIETAHSGVRAPHLSLQDD